MDGPLTILTLANQVLDSIQVELSDRAKAEQAEALQGLDDARLSTTEVDATATGG